MNNKLIYFFLVLILVIMAFNSFRSCSDENKRESVYQRQIAQYDSLTKQVERLAASRIDSTIIIEKQIPVIVKIKEGKQNEVFNTHDIDSVIRLYNKYRPK